jgi:ABC-type bacteriocin/lantibiotic exporter with double-glycine peptidase domain
MDRFKEIIDDLKNKTLEYYVTIDRDRDVMLFYSNIIVIGFLYFSIHGVFSKNIDKKTFITFVSIIILYRDKMEVLLEQFCEFVDFYCRTALLEKHFSKFDNSQLNTYHDSKVKELWDLPFYRIQFQDISFQYNNKVVFYHYNLELNTNNRSIIGFVGQSGKGKSALAKLLLKMYSGYDGTITIDGVNLREIDADYIRSNITYVNQNSKMFDKKVIENIFYGCKNKTECQAQLERIMGNYPKIRELFDHIDIYNKKAGPLGENLSGGQRQIINIVGGLINPSKIVIFDEPTNALDGDLKKEVLAMIGDYRVNKQCIFIITHDRDAFHLFDKQVNL